MSIPIPAWVSRALGLPGAASFHRFDSVVRVAGLLADEARTLDAESLRDQLRSEARGLPERPFSGRLLALLREAAVRTVGLRAFDEQLVACCALLSGHGVEMDTGEGKTLVGALAAAGHAAAGRRVHVLSVNDYLAERDATWTGAFFASVGVSVAWVGQHTPAEERRRAYACDVVYAPVSEIGFDVLRDRFAVTPAERVDPVFEVVIVDEADAVMIDEAMVPLVLAGTSDDQADEFGEATALVEQLIPEDDFAVDPDQATVTLTDEGLDRIEARLGGINLYDAEHIATLTRINLALHARVLLHRDVDYLVSDEKIKLVNTTRGRVAHLQRWPDGLHAALEAKEHLPVSAPGVILDTITIQDLLLRYELRSGMSGTVVAVAEELIEFYELSSGRVERHEPDKRVDEPDTVLLAEPEKIRAILEEIEARHRAGQPVLVGTQSVAESEQLDARLREVGIEARVLNAKNDAEEAAIVARAGEYAAVTISTQMSGRGTDIRLGGADERDRDRVVAAGGLAVIATTRYPSRRLDAQLRGRAGRQGDPGTSRTVLSVEDDLLQLHMTPRMHAKIARQGESLPQAERRRMVNACQAASERARTLQHRLTWTYSRAIAAQRETVLDHRRQIIDSRIAIARLSELTPAKLTALENARGQTAVAATIRAVALHYLDEQWIAHLALLQEIRDGIHLRALAGQKPADEFHRIALREFHGFFDAVYRDTADLIETLSSEDIGRDPEDLGLRRPSATWTYMATDNPFGGAGSRFMGRVVKLIRSDNLKLE
ncbi:accessory Sec system translocase SecA2 [Microbacterium lacticum]|uniref:accessory Sec system translocase SecA2 n=1 Tax=Microbacterium lacticum TaxID=33885 RepID=UPI001F5A61CD|nr:accessory Sec system translocase SecA2 [Microbacterium lacticum]